MAYSFKDHILHIKDAPEDWEPTFIVEGCWMENGLNVINGSPKAHKSVLRRYLTACAISGSPAFGSCRINKLVKRPLVLIGEDHPGAERAMTTNLLKLMDYHELPNIEYVQSPKFWLDKPDQIRSLASYVDNEGIDLLIVDSLRSFHMQGENDSADINKIFGPLTELKHKTTVVVVHHAGKGGKFSKTDIDTRTAGEMSRGSGAIAGYADTTLALTRTGKSDKHGIRFETKNAEEPEDATLLLDRDTWTWQMVGSMNVDELILHMLSLSESESKNRLRMKCGTGSNVFSAMLKKLESSGKIRIIHGGSGKADRVSLI